MSSRNDFLDLTENKTKELLYKYTHTFEVKG